eukprot:1720249-Amphidinium_carterae.1
MSPSRTSEQPAMIQDYTAVRGQRSPRAGAGNPYSTPVDRPQALSVDGPQRVPHAQTTLHVH